MRKSLLLGLTLVGVLIFGTAVAVWGQASMLTGVQWSEISYDAKVGYVKGVGNLADFECQAGAFKQSRSFCLASSLVQELKEKTIDVVVKEIDQYYMENPGKKNTTVLEVMLRRAALVCPPGTTK